MIYSEVDSGISWPVVVLELPSWAVNCQGFVVLDLDSELFLYIDLFQGPVVGLLIGLGWMLGE